MTPDEIKILRERMIERVVSLSKKQLAEIELKLRLVSCMDGLSDADKREFAREAFELMFPAATFPEFFPHVE